MPLATRSSSDVTGDTGGCHRQRNEVMRCDAWRRWTWPWASRPMDFLISIRLSTRARKRHAAYRYADAGEEGSSGGSAYAAADDGGRAAREAAAKDGWFAPSRGRGVRLLIDTRFRSLSSPRPQASGGKGIFCALTCIGFGWTRPMGERSRPDWLYMCLLFFFSFSCWYATVL